MSNTNLVLGPHWDRFDWPDHVDVSHEGAGDGVRYVPEVRRRDTCIVESSISGWGEDDTWYEFELSCGDSFPWWDSCPPDFCPYCGCEVITDAD